MEQWHHLKHKKTGQEQLVSSLDGYDKREWHITPLDREPGHHEHVVDGKLVNDTELQRRAEAEGRFHTMHRGELMLMIEDLASRVTKLEGLIHR